MRFLVDWISLQVRELLGYGACYLFITWSTVSFENVLFILSVFSLTVHIVINTKSLANIPLASSLSCSLCSSRSSVYVVVRS